MNTIKGFIIVSVMLCTVSCKQKISQTNQASTSNQKVVKSEKQNTTELQGNWKLNDIDNDEGKSDNNVLDEDILAVPAFFEAGARDELSSPPSLAAKKVVEVGSNFKRIRTHSSSSSAAFRCAIPSNLPCKTSSSSAAFRCAVPTNLP